MNQLVEMLLQLNSNLMTRGEKYKKAAIAFIYYKYQGHLTRRLELGPLMSFKQGMTGGQEIALINKLECFAFRWIKTFSYDPRRIELS